MRLFKTLCEFLPHKYDDTEIITYKLNRMVINASELDITIPICKRCGKKAELIKVEYYKII